MSTYTTETRMILYPEGSWAKKLGWYGMGFFLIKGVLWLIIPLIMYTIH
jgi:hypothetical protein